MTGYIRRIRGLPPDIKLFMVYNIFANVGFGVSELIFNLYLVELGFREDYIGEWRAVLTIGMAVTAASIGTIINRFSAWRAIAGGFSALLAVSVLLSFAEQQYLLLVLAAAYGISLAFLFNPLMPFILEYAPAEQRQYVSAISFSLVSLSMMIGSLVGGFAPAAISAVMPGIDKGGIDAYRGALITGALIASLGLIPLFRMQEPRRWTRRPVVHQPVTTAAERSERKQLRTDIGVFVLAGGLMSIGVGMVQPFYNVFLKSVGASNAQVGYVFALGGLCAAVFGLTAPWMANHVGSLRAVLYLRIIIVPFYVALVLSPTFGLAVLAFLSRQITISMAWPIDSTFIGELLPPKARSGVYGLRSAAWNMGFAVASFTAGRIIVDRGYGLTFAAMALFTTLAAATFYFYFSRHPLVTSGEMPNALPRKRRIVTSPPSTETQSVAE